MWNLPEGERERRIGPLDLREEAAIFVAVERDSRASEERILREKNREERRIFTSQKAALG